MEPSGIRPHPGFQAGWGQYGDCPFLDFSRRAPSLLAVAPEKPASASDVPEEIAGSRKNRSKRLFQGHVRFRVQEPRRNGIVGLQDMDGGKR
jgi:hypothetical protein